MADYLKGLDILKEATDGIDALYYLIIAADDLGGLDGQTLGCLMGPLLKKLRASQQLLEGSEPAFPAPPDGGMPLTPDTVDDLLRTLKDPPLDDPQRQRKRA